MSEEKNFLDNLVGVMKGGGKDAPKIELFIHPGCPFAHRAWLAMVEKKIDHSIHYIPLSGELKKDDVKELHAHWQNKDLDMEKLNQIKTVYKETINAAGEVPSLRYQGKVVKEADICTEFLDDLFPTSGLKLMPADPFVRAQIRELNKVMGSPDGVMAHYRLLMNQDPTKDQEIIAMIHKGYAKMMAIADVDGPFLCGKEPTMADVMYAPMWDRFRHTLKHWRGLELYPEDKPWSARFKVWAEAYGQRPAFIETSQGGEYYCKMYAGYAGARGQSTL